MDIIGDLEREWQHLRHHETSAAPGAATATIEATTGGPVSNVLTEAKNILHDGLAKLEAVDEEAINVTEAIKASPVAVSIANTLASVAHVPDPMNVLPSVDALLKAFAASLAAGAAATAPADPAPSFTPVGPQVGGQAH